MASPRPPRDLPPPDPPNPTDAHIQIKHQPATQNDITQDECFVRNSSFLSRDIEAQKIKLDKSSPPKNVPPPRKSSLIKENSKDSSTNSNSPSVKTLSPPDVIVASPPKKEVVNKINHLPSLRNEVKQIQKSKVTSPPVSQVTSPPVSKVSSPPVSKVSSPPVSKISSPPISKVTSPPVGKVSLPPVSKVTSPPVSKVTSPPVSKLTSPLVTKVASPPLKNIVSPPPNRDSPISTKNEVLSPTFNKGVTSPPINSFKFNRTDSISDENIIANKKKETMLAKEAPIKSEKLSLITSTNEISDKVIGGETNTSTNNTNNKPTDVENGDKSAKIAESNGVGDKIRKFEKAAEDASANAGKLSRPGSVRGRSRTDRLGSDSKEDLPPPATPFKDHVFFDLGNTSTTESHVSNNAEPQEKIVTKGLVNSAALKWQRNEATEEKIQKPEPQKIIKPEFKPMPSPIDVTIRSPSLGSKLPDQFPSHGTAFRNVASPDTARPSHKVNEDINTQNYKCKPKNKEKYSVSKGSSYFTRGSEEIWLVKKKDIEEIEERVLDSFRRAGGNMCMRSESMRPSSDSGQSTAFTHATMGRTKRQMYGRSESLDPQWAGTRAQTLKRQSSVACTCGHDKKTRAKSVETTPRPRSRSHGDDNNQAHVLDKYETLV